MASLKDVVNASITQTLTRSIYTSSYDFCDGGCAVCDGRVFRQKGIRPADHGGYSRGAYSSVCLTGPLWYVMKTTLGKKLIIGKEECRAVAGGNIRTGRQRKTGACEGSLCGA